MHVFLGEKIIKSREWNKIGCLWPNSPQCNLVADVSNCFWPVTGQYCNARGRQQLPVKESNRQRFNYSSLNV